MFQAQSKEISESGAYQTTGMDVVVTAERVILIDTQVSLFDRCIMQAHSNISYCQGY